MANGGEHLLWTVSLQDKIPAIVGTLCTFSKKVLTTEMQGRKQDPKPTPTQKLWKKNKTKELWEKGLSLLRNADLVASERMMRQKICLYCFRFEIWSGTKKKERAPDQDWDSPTGDYFSPPEFVAKRPNNHTDFPEKRQHNQTKKKREKITNQVQNITPCITEATADVIEASSLNSIRNSL